MLPLPHILPEETLVAPIHGRFCSTRICATGKEAAIHGFCANLSRSSGRIGTSVPRRRCFAPTDDKGLEDAADRGNLTLVRVGVGECVDDVAGDDADAAALSGTLPG